MDFEWDERKRSGNVRKHGVDFADAVGVFFDDHAVTIEDPDHHDEQRFITTGMDTKGRILVVVYAYRGEDAIRIVSAREANGHERRQYEGIP